MEERIVAALGRTLRAMEDRLLEDARAMEDRINATMRDHVTVTSQALEDRTAALIAAEISALHVEIRGIDRKLRHEAGLATTLMDLATKQARWHEESDNAVLDLTNKQTEFVHTLAEMPRLIEELRGRIEILERKAS